MKRNIHIFKVGGGVLHSPENFKQFIQSIPYMGTTDEPVMRIFVISAFGTITQRIQAMIDALTECDGLSGELLAEKSIEEITKIVFKILGTNDTKKLYHTKRQLTLFRVSIFGILRTKQSGVALTEAQQAQVLQYGELISSSAVFDFCASSPKNTVEFIESEEVIKTRGNYLCGTVTFDRTKELLGEQFAHIQFRHPDGNDVIVIMPGFISSEAVTGAPTLLGLEGSDYTAAIVAHAAFRSKLDFESVELTFVKGSPGISLNYQGKDSVFEEEVTWDQVEEKVAHGDKILHPKVIGLLKNTSIPVTVTNLEFFSSPDTHKRPATKIISKR